MPLDSKPLRTQKGMCCYLFFDADLVVSQLQEKNRCKNLINQQQTKPGTKTKQHFDLCLDKTQTPISALSWSVYCLIDNNQTLKEPHLVLMTHWLLTNYETTLSGG